jgi:hypothetical protein
MVSVTDYTNLVPPQHADKPLFMAWVSYLSQPFVDNQNLLITFPNIFDIDVAVGQQLDMLGVKIGLSRQLQTLLTNVFFSLDTPGLGLDQGVWQGSYDATTGITVLDDDHYRILLKARIAANNWDGTIPGAYTAWNTIFQPEGYQILIQNGRPAAAYYLTLDGTVQQGLDYAAWLTNNPGQVSGGMTMLMALIAPYSAPPAGLVYFTLDDTAQDGLDAGYLDATPEPIAGPAIDAVTLALFTGGYLNLKPAAVRIEYYVTQSLTGTPIFALDCGPSSASGVTAPPTMLAGLDIGAWGTLSLGA